MSRIVPDLSDWADVNYAGSPLSRVLSHHASMRAEAYFMFLFYLNAVFEVLKIEDSPQRLACIQEKASHQYGKGVRRRCKSIPKFDKQDDSIATASASNWRSMDAAHLCNLGTTNRFRAIVGNAPQSEQLNALLAELEGIQAYTAPLPQKVNVNNDRVIDKLNYQLAQTALRSDLLTFTRTAVGHYFAQATVAMANYRDRKTRKDERALVSCAENYLSYYNKADSQQGIYADLRGYFQNEVEEYSLTLSRYIA